MKERLSIKHEEKKNETQSKIRTFCEYNCKQIKKITGMRYGMQVKKRKPKTQGEKIRYVSAVREQKEKKNMKKIASQLDNRTEGERERKRESVDMSEV